MKKALALVFLACCLTVNAFGVSRVGGGRSGRVADSTIGFMADIPFGYPSAQDAGGGSLRLLGIPMLAFGANPRPPVIEIHPFSKAYPEYSSLDRAALDRDLAGKGWAKRNHADACIDVRWIRGQTATTVIAAWGQAKGVALVSPATPQAERDLLSIVDSIKLDPGACQW